MKEDLREKRRRAGRAGGLATVAKHGRDYMATIGRRGAAEFYRRYRVLPAGPAGWAIVPKAGGAPVAFIGGRFQRRTA